MLECDAMLFLRSGYHPYLISPDEKADLNEGQGLADDLSSKSSFLVK
jgi:hypothetical protein